LEADGGKGVPVGRGLKMRLRCGEEEKKLGRVKDIDNCKPSTTVKCFKGLAF